MKRKELREKIMQILFQIDVAKIELADAINLTLEGFEISDNDLNFIKDMVNGTLEHQEEIDQLLGKYLKGWTLSRLANVDRSVLRMATYELLFSNQVPTKIVLNEAIELAKIFGTDESGKFVNGVLGALVKDNPVLAEDKS